MCGAIAAVCGDVVAARTPAPCAAGAIQPTASVDSSMPTSAITATRRCHERTSLFAESRDGTEVNRDSCVETRLDTKLDTSVLLCERRKWHKETGCVFANAVHEALCGWGLTRAMWKWSASGRSHFAGQLTDIRSVVSPSFLHYSGNALLTCFPQSVADFHQRCIEDGLIMPAVRSRNHAQRLHNTYTITRTIGISILGMSARNSRAACYDALV